VSLPRARLDDAQRLSGGIWILSKDESHHLVHVRRCRIGDEFEGLLEGCKLMLIIKGYEDGKVIAEETKRLPPSEMKMRTVLLTALVKSGTFEDILNHATELGVTEIVPILAERCVVRVDDRLPAKMARWKRIIEEATKVSGIDRPPLLHRPLRPMDLREDMLPSLRLIGALTDDARPLGGMRIDAEGGVAFAVGPEGDWTKEEISLFLRLNFIPVSLGPNILRANTAAVAGLSYIILSAEGGLS